MIRLLSVCLSIMLGLASASQAATLTFDSYYHNDHLGSPVAATDERGDLLWRAHFRPYGERQENPTDAAFGNVGYTGHMQDADSGLVYMQARYYDPVIGRFMAVDPVGVEASAPASFNRYAYANNNPYKYVDPDGRAAVAIEVGALVLGGSAIAYGTCGGSGNPWCTAVRGLGDRLIDGLGNLLHNESSSGNADVGDEEGCIYCVSGGKTKSGKDYIGSTDDLSKRQKDKSDGRDRAGAEIVDTYPKGDRDSRRAKEQQAMNDRGGVNNLDNKRNEVSPKKWNDKGILPP